MLMVSGSALAQHHGYHPYYGHRHWHPHYGWVIPSIIGGVVVYEVMKNQPPVVVQQPPVVIQQPQPTVQQQQTCTEWHEVLQPNGTVTRERTCYQK